MHPDARFVRSFLPYYIVYSVSDSYVKLELLHSLQLRRYSWESIMAIAYYFQSDFCRFRCRGNSNKSWGQSVQAASKAPFAGANISKAVKKTIIIQIKLIENEKNRFKSDCHCLRIRNSQRSEYSCRVH